MPYYRVSASHVSVHNMSSFCTSRLVTNVDIREFHDTLLSYHINKLRKNFLRSLINFAQYPIHNIIKRSTVQVNSNPVMYVRSPVRWPLSTSYYSSNFRIYYWRIKVLKRVFLCWTYSKRLTSTWKWSKYTIVLSVHNLLSWRGVK